MPQWKKIISAPVFIYLYMVIFAVLAIWGFTSPDRERVFFIIIGSPFFVALGAIWLLVMAIYSIARRINKDPGD